LKIPKNTPGNNEKYHEKSQKEHLIAIVRLNHPPINTTLANNNNESGDDDSNISLVSDHNVSLSKALIRFLRLQDMLEGQTVSKAIFFFVCRIPFYLQAAQLHSANV
jgi:hypothetical protein